MQKMLYGGTSNEFVDNFCVLCINMIGGSLYVWIKKLFVVCPVLEKWGVPVRNSIPSRPWDS